MSRAELTTMINGKATSMEFMRRYPRTPEGLIGWCKGLSMVIQDQPHVFDAEHPDGWTAEQTLDWLIDRALVEFMEFPSVAELYEIYCERGFLAADKAPPPGPEVIAREKWLFLNPDKGIDQYTGENK